MIPDINRHEWQDLVKGNIKVKFSSFSLQMKVSSLSRNYKLGLINLQTAVKDLYEMCIKYEKIYTKDLEKIFKN